MRFLAQLTNVNLLISTRTAIFVIRLIRLLEIVQTVDKIGKACIVHLTPKKVEFILTSDITDGVQVWSGVNVVC